MFEGEEVFRAHYNDKNIPIVIESMDNTILFENQIITPKYTASENRFSDSKVDMFNIEKKEKLNLNNKKRMKI